MSFFQTSGKCCQGLHPQHVETKISTHHVPMVCQSEWHPIYGAPVCYPKGDDEGAQCMLAVLGYVLFF